MNYIDKIFPEPLPLIEEIENKYPPRELAEGQRVTRIAPSPTGFMHIGGIYAALISERVAHQSGGIFYLRIEDTDTKREVEGATALIASSIRAYGIIPDEGVDVEGMEHGSYGPYCQSERKLIYQAYIKKLLEEGKAYPCFSTPEELEEIRKHQELSGARLGYYGKWAKSRNLPKELVEEKINAGEKFVIRFKSEGVYDNKITISDLSKGKRDFPENDLDIVIMKSDGLPTYHFAHIVDDHLMGTTHVIRGDEWLASLPLHVQLFRTMGWKAPKYTHIAPIQKMEDSSRRKLSKRKDPEASVSFYDEEGYPKDAVVEYLLNLANSSFEDWRKQNQDKPNNQFKLDLSKLNASGALFDFVKLDSISKDIVAKLSGEEVYDNVYAWATQYDKELQQLMDVNAAYVKNILNIERLGVKNVRKDIAKWSDVKNEISFFFDDKFELDAEDVYAQLEKMSKEDVKNIVAEFKSLYNPAMSKDEWFGLMLEIAGKFGYAKNAKEYKANPEVYKGDVSDVVKVFRILLTGKPQSPDLYSVMQVMGEGRVVVRLGRLA